jgi:magnesium chelatase family protein
MSPAIRVRSAVLVGIDSHPVTVTATAKETFGLTIVGLSDAATRETRVRVRSALAACSIEAGNVEVSIVPEIPASSSGLDLAIALAVAALRSKTPPELDATGYAFLGTTVVGELSLDGHVHAVRGALAHARAVGKGGILVPAANAADATMSDAAVFSCLTLGEALREGWGRVKSDEPTEAVPLDDFTDIPHASVRRALEISVAGDHPILLVGAPGSGKILAARRLATILPRLTRPEMINVVTIHDAAGLRVYGKPAITRPFRAPHHTVSEIGLLGGGDSTPRPGEVTLAHHGVLYLDEIHEFRRSSLEALQRVLAERKTTLYRRSSYVTMPAVPLLVGSTNGCECGYLYSTDRQCTCTPERLKRYRERAVSYESLFSLRVEVTGLGSPSESTAKIRARVECARALFATAPHAKPATAVACIARTIAALDGRDIISADDMGEAYSLQVRL